MKQKKKEIRKEKRAKMFSFRATAGSWRAKKGDTGFRCLPAKLT